MSSHPPWPCPAVSSTWDVLLPHYLENFHSSLKKCSRATFLVRFSLIPDKLFVLPPPGEPPVHAISSLFIHIFVPASNGLLRTGPQSIHLCNVCGTHLRHYIDQVLKESLLIKCIWQKFSDYVFNCQEFHRDIISEVTTGWWERWVGGVSKLKARCYKKEGANEWERAPGN